MKISIQFQLPHDLNNYNLYVNAKVNNDKLVSINNYVADKINKNKLTTNELKILQDILDIIKEGNDK